MTLIKTNPWKELESLTYKMDRFFDGLPLFSQNYGYEIAPKFEVYEDKDSFYVDAELPGVSKDDIKVSLQDGILSINGSKKKDEEKNNKNYFIAERRYGSFTRSIKLPDNLRENEIGASFENGLLMLKIAKSEPQVTKEMLIEIK